MFIDGAEDAPPEDVGGLPGYYQFLEIYNNPKHPLHKEYRTWAQEQFFREFEKERINSMLKSLKYKKTEWDKVHQMENN
ncbi:IS1096 element passenger TnpR family protein [Bacillaceae bacterium W0354]